MSGFSTDVCVPISRLADCVTETIEDAKRIGIVAPIVGHVGDGNFHSGPMFDPNDPEDVARAKPSWNGSCGAASRWAAPARASTASVRPRSNT